MKTKHALSKPFICVELKCPQWHIINVNQESDMQRFEKEIDKPLCYQNPYLIDYLRKAIRGQRMALKFINKTTGLFN